MEDNVREAAKIDQEEARGAAKSIVDEFEHTLRFDEFDTVRVTRKGLQLLVTLGYTHGFGDGFRKALDFASDALDKAGLGASDG